jgi:DNA-binding NarL/FixJ family response regulator
MMTERIRIMLVDDQRLMRDGLRTLLELEPDLEVVGEAGDGQEALDIYATARPDVVLMDIRCSLWTGWKQPGVCAPAGPSQGDYPDHI